MTLLECNMDDMDGERFGYLMELLLERGAADAWMTPVYMKKGRPGTQLSALCVPERARRIARLILSESTTLGVRIHTVQRETLERRSMLVKTPYGPIHMKEALGAGRAKPEYEEARALAREHGVPLTLVLNAAAAAYAGERGGGGDEGDARGPCPLEPPTDAAHPGTGLRTVRNKEE